RPWRRALASWSPLRPLAPAVQGWREAGMVLGSQRRVLQIAVALVGLGSLLWPHLAVPIGFGAGVVLVVLLLVRIGVLRDLARAVEATQGLPPLEAVLRCMLNDARKPLSALHGGVYVLLPRRWWRNLRGPLHHDPGHALACAQVDRTSPGEVLT